MGSINPLFADNSSTEDGSAVVIPLAESTPEETTTETAPAEEETVFSSPDPELGNFDFDAAESTIEQTTEPVVEEIVAEPVVEETVAEPVVEEPVPEPIIEEPVVEPTTEPVLEEPAPEPTIEETLAEPVVEETSPEPIVEQTPEPAADEPIVEETSTEPVVEETVLDISEPIADLTEPALDEPSGMSALKVLNSLFTPRLESSPKVRS